MLSLFRPPDKSHRAHDETETANKKTKVSGSLLSFFERTPEGLTDYSAAFFLLPLAKGKPSRCVGLQETTCMTQSVTEAAQGLREMEEFNP